jgi:hypothetical protein
MTLRSTLWILGALLLGAAPAQAAPAQLIGKSVVIGFTENRVQRMADWPDFRSVSIGAEISVYISSAGRTFSRLQMSSRRGRRGGTSTGKADRVGNSARAVTSFQGNTMTIMSGGAGGARRTVVTFGTGFTTCEASTVRAKPAGQGVIRAKSLIRGGIANEIRSIEITGISCRVVDGNVFAGG